MYVVLIASELLKFLGGGERLCHDAVVDEVYVRLCRK